MIDTIKIENMQSYGFEAAIRGMRNPMNSWDKSDSHQDYYDFGHGKPAEFVIGPNDFELMKKLVKAGSDHRKFLRMITVTMDITAPMYWWKEFDTYKVGTVRNSCSTMHKIHEKEFIFDDFSHERLMTWSADFLAHDIIGALNDFREKYIKTKDKTYWWQMIQLLPSSYNQRATVQLNYEALMNMYHSRKNHKLDEWHYFCETIKTLPYFEDFINE